MTLSRGLGSFPEALAAKVNVKLESPVQSIEIREDPALGRGELRLQTDLGNIDARLAPRFERLAAALRDALL